MTPAQQISARTIGETFIAMQNGNATADDYRAAMRASREQHGDDMHEIIKAHALAGVSRDR